MLQILLRYLALHSDAIMQVLGTLLSPFMPQSLNALRSGKRAERKRLKEERIRRSNAERDLQSYTSKVIEDPHISQIQIVGMTQPLKLEDVYVRLRIHPESTLKFTLDPKLREAEETHDPNLLLEAAQKSLEQLVDGAIDPDEAIRDNQYCVIVGNPGAGKTTLLRYLTIKAAKKELPGLPCIPIYVQLNTFKSTMHRDLLDLILRQIDDHLHASDVQALHELVGEKMKAGEVLLLLDGLDETKIGVADKSADDTYTSMVSAIMKLVRMYPRLRIVVTVRKAGYQHYPKLTGFVELEVVAFRPEDSKTFITNWFNAYRTTSREEKIKGLISHLERNLRIQSLVSNPLLLSLIAIVYEGHLELPERRADFYKQCIEVLQTRWDASRDIKRRHEFPLMFQSQLLQEIAWHFHNQGRHYFPVDELLQVISKFLPTVDIPADQSRHVLEQIDMENGLLREQAHGWYGFSHLTFQEYFVTQYIIANNRQEELLRHLGHPWWEEVVLLYVGSINDASGLLHLLLGHDKEKPLQDDLFFSYLILAGRCLAEKPRILDLSLREEIITRLFKIMLTTTCSLTREQVAHTLARIGGSRVNNRLLGYLASNDENLLAVRESIGCALGAAGERGLAPRLADLLSQRQTGRYIRIIIARVLGVLGERGVAPTLLRLLADKQEDMYVQQSIALTLGLLGDQDIAAALVQLLDDTRANALVQQSIVVALGILGNPGVAPALQDLLTDVRLDWHVRASAAKVLGQLGKQEVIPVMMDILRDNYDNTYVRRRIVTALGSFREDVIPAGYLLNLLFDDSIRAEVRCSIAQTLGTIRRQSTAPALLRLLTDTQVEACVRTSAAIALGHLGVVECVAQTLSELWADQHLDQNLRASIAAALGMLGMSYVAPDLLRFLVDPNINQDILLHIVHALGNLSDHDTLDKQEIAHELVGLLASENIDRYRGQNIVRLLCALGESAIVPPLLDLLSATRIDRSVRQGIAEVLAQLACDERSLARLAALLETTDIADDVFRALWAVGRRVKGRGSG